MRIGFALLTVALSACAADDAPDEGAGPPEAPPPAAPAPGDAPAVSDPQIAAIVVAANEVDMRTAELARERAADPRVTEFAERMITDHTGFNRAAGELVTRLGVTPEPSPTSMQLRQGGEEAVAELGTLSGAEFDRAYIAHEVDYHRAVLEAIDQTLIPSAENAELRQLLEQTRPAIEAHLQHAQRLQEEFGGG